MNNLERLSLIDRIGRELQSRMSYSDIDTYLAGHGVDIKKETSGTNSKWVYSKELLADTPPDTLLRIADELEVPHSYAVTSRKETVEAAFWAAGHFRLFLSHISSFKATIAKLQSALHRFGISAFVAHVDIEPTREWQDEIEAGLFSMDALAAVLMPGFPESKWTDQEVGVAVGRGALIVPIMRGLNPYGFIGKYQGLQAEGKTVTQVARSVFDILVTSPTTRNRMLTCFVDTAVQLADSDTAAERVECLRSLVGVPDTILERLRDGAAASAAFAAGRALDDLNALLRARGLGQVAQEASPHSDFDEVPF